MTHPPLAAPAWSFAHSPTVQLLLLCLHPAADGAIQGQIQAAAQRCIAWDELLDLATDHHSVALLYTRLHRLCPDQVPGPVLATLRQHYQRVVANNLLLTAELASLLHCMAHQGIDATPYKGPALAQTLYGRMDLRQFGDLDIIVPPEAIEAVEQILRDRGYQPYFGDKTAAQLRAYMAAKSEHTYDFYHPAKGILVEVHWRFWPVYFSAVHPREIWPRREAIALGGLTVPTLALEDYVLVLCMHGSRHLWCRLSWLADIARLLHQHPHLAWDQVLAQAQTWGCQRMLYLGVYLAHHWLGAPVPDPLVAPLAGDRTLASLARLVDHRSFGLATQPSPAMGTTRYQLQVRERLQDKARYLESLAHWLWTRPQRAAQ